MNSEQKGQYSSVKAFQWGKVTVTVDSREFHTLITSFANNCAITEHMQLGLYILYACPRVTCPHVTVEDDKRKNKWSHVMSTNSKTILKHEIKSIRIRRSSRLGKLSCSRGWWYDNILSPENLFVKRLCTVLMLWMSRIKCDDHVTQLYSRSRRTCYKSSNY